MITTSKKIYHLYHGFRTKQPIDKIEKLITFTPSQARHEVELALAAFSYDYLIYEKQTKKPSSTTLIHGILDEVNSKGRFGEYIPTCPFLDRMENWAFRNPEIIWLTLDYVDVPKERILEYLTDRFGKPYIAQLKHTEYTSLPTPVVLVRKPEIPIDEIELIWEVDTDPREWVRSH